MKTILANILFLLLLTGCIGNIINTSIETRVSGLIHRMTISEKSGTRAFSELISIGDQATPYLICHLGDMRPLAMRGVTLKNNSPDAFEALRHHSPNTVHDALSIILTQTTGHHFSPVYNGATPQEREENKQKWIDWHNSEYPHQLKIEKTHCHYDKYTNDT